MANPTNVMPHDRTMTGESASIFLNAGAPTNGTSGTYAGRALQGDLLVDFTNGLLYQNTSTQASPTWTAHSATAPTTSTVATAGAAQTISTDYTLITLSANLTITLPALTLGKKIRIKIVNDGTHTVTWPVATKNIAGAALPTMTSGAGKKDYYELSCDAVTWDFIVVAQDIR